MPERASILPEMTAIVPERPSVLPERATILLLFCLRRLLFFYVPYFVLTILYSKRFHVH